MHPLVLIHFHRTSNDKIGNSCKPICGQKEGGFRRGNLTGTDFEVAQTQVYLKICVFSQAAFSIRGLSRKEIRKLTVKNEMYVKSMKHTVSHQKLPKSASCESLALKVSRSFSGPMALEADSGLLAANEVRRLQALPCSSAFGANAFSK